ncbi:MAG: MATE family multidrug resistance protein [Myxococcota bacterium]|jgi:MATE family multidrug resistance protein
MQTATNSFSSPVRAMDVLRLAWPIVVSMLSYTCTSLVDVLVVGWLGTTELAAVGLAVTGLYLVRAMGLGVLSGSRIATAQATGAGRHSDAERYGWHTVYMGLAFGILVLPATVVSYPVFLASGATPDVAAMAASYTNIMLFGAVFTFLLFGLTAWFQGRGDTRTPMVANVVSNVLNAVLTPALVFGVGAIPAMGISGAGLATVIGTAVGAACLIVPLALRSGRSAFAGSRRLFSHIARLGFPMGFAWTLDVGSFAGFVAILAACGNEHLAAHVLVMRIVSVSFLPGHAIGQAAGVLAGQAVGAGRPDVARQSVYAGLRVATVIMVPLGVVFWLAPEFVLAPFSVAPDVAALATTLLLIAAGFQVFDAIAMVLFQGISGAGDTRFVTVTMTLAAWLVKLPIGYAFAIPLGLGAVGAWLGFTVEIIVVAAVLAARLRSGRWLLSPMPVAALAT